MRRPGVPSGPRVGRLLAGIRLGSRPPRLSALIPRAIESAFARCDPSPLWTAFSSRVKAFLASPALEIPAGYFGADQVLLMLRRMFAGGHLVAARQRHRQEDPARSDVRLLFTPAPEGPIWYIRELK